MKTKAIFAAMLLALASLPSVAQDFDFERDSKLLSGMDAYLSGDYATALQVWVPLAEQGNATAQIFLGSMYKDGKGVPQDYLEAVRLYRLAAKQGYSGAQYNLGWMYFMGEGVAEDHVLAHMWINIAAADNGHERAVKFREVLDLIITTADISEAQRRTRVCMESNYQDCG